jgi:hypothetical protein
MKRKRSHVSAKVCTIGRAAEEYQEIQARYRAQGIDRL